MTILEEAWGVDAGSPGSAHTSALRFPSPASQDWGMRGDSDGEDENELADDDLVEDGEDRDEGASLLTRLGRTRIALVAAEAAALFEREGGKRDPIEWMMRPRAAFGGRAAIDACHGRTECLSAVLLLGAEADEAEDALFSDMLDIRPEASPNAASRAGQDLFAALVDLAGRTVFLATIADGEADIRRVVRARYGLEAAATAQVMRDRPEILRHAEAIGPGAKAMLADVAGGVVGGAMERFEVCLERRFDS